MAESAKPIRVEIYDCVYQLKSGADENYTLQLARAVDQTMREIGEKTQTVDSLRLAVLAALHFADECELLRRRYERLSGLVSQKSIQYGESLDRAAGKAG